MYLQQRESIRYATSISSKLHIRIPVCEEMLSVLQNVCAKGGYSSFVFSSGSVSSSAATMIYPTRTAFATKAADPAA